MYFPAWRLRIVTRSTIRNTDCGIHEDGEWVVGGAAQDWRVAMHYMDPPHVDQERSWNLSTRTCIHG